MIRLLLTHGHAPSREELRLRLATTPGLEIVGEAGTSDELLLLLGSAAPTVVLLDLNLPGPDAFALLPALRQQYPQVRVLARSDQANEHYVSRAFSQGAHGYLLANALPIELQYGLTTVAAGRPFLCTAIGLTLMGHFDAEGSATGDAGRAALGLSKREMEVLGLVAEGLTNTEIAAKLFTSKRTIETHRQNIITKTNTKNTAALIRLAARQGLLPK